ncbi:MAG: DUF2244 domain-containing protein [Steroidobacteraceae bacterium]
MFTVTAQRIEIAPNCSLSVRGAALFFASLCVATFAVAGAFAWRGAWPVLPFAGLEMLLFGWALRASLRRRFQAQIITLSEREVGVEIRDGAQRRAAVFPRHWARVKLRAARSPLHPSSLTIESHGRACEIGTFLTEEERRGLAARLKRLIGRVDESPLLQSQD